MRQQTKVVNYINTNFGIDIKDPKEVKFTYNNKGIAVVTKEGRIEFSTTPTKLTFSDIFNYIKTLNSDQISTINVELLSISYFNASNEKSYAVLCFASDDAYLCLGDNKIKFVVKTKLQ